MGRVFGVFCKLFWGGFLVLSVIFSVESSAQGREFRFDRKVFVKSLEKEMLKQLCDKSSKPFRKCFNHASKQLCRKRVAPLVHKCLSAAKKHYPRQITFLQSQLMAVRTGHCVGPRYYKRYTVNKARTRACMKKAARHNR